MIARLRCLPDTHPQVRRLREPNPGRTGRPRRAGPGLGAEPALGPAARDQDLRRTAQDQPQEISLNVGNVASLRVSCYSFRYYELTRQETTPIPCGVPAGGSKAAHVR